MSVVSGLQQAHHNNTPRYTGKVDGVIPIGLGGVVKLTQVVNGHVYAAVDDHTDGWDLLLAALGGKLYACDRVIYILELQDMENCLYIRKLSLE